MSFFVKACVEALKTVPVVNGHIENDDFIQNNFYDIGVPVGTERGLVVPVVRDADKKSFADLERDIADYVIRARRETKNRRSDRAARSPTQTAECTDRSLPCRF